MENLRTSRTVGLEPGLVITVTVTSPDDSRTKVYRLRLPEPETCLGGAVAEVSAS